MLRITIHDDPDLLTFQLEGKLAGTWVWELEKCWQRAGPARAKSAIRFDLTEVVYIDAAGRALLAERHAEGAQLVAKGCLMRAVVAEIINTAPNRAQRDVEQKHCPDGVRP